MTNEKDLYDRFIGLTDKIKMNTKVNEMDWTVITPEMKVYFNDTDSIYRTVRFGGYEVTVSFTHFYKVEVNNSYTLSDFSLEIWINILEREVNRLYNDTIMLNGKKYKLVNEGENNDK